MQGSPQKATKLVTLRLAQLSWLIPLACLLISIAVNLAIKPQGPVGGYILGGGAAVGFLLALFSLVTNRKDPGVPANAFGGLIMSLTFAVMIAGMVWFTGIVRNTGERFQKNQPGIGRRTI
jgi:hypothetical protein